MGQSGATSTITNCYAQGAVTATTSGANGGLIGSANIGGIQTITNNYSSGAVSGGAANNGLIGARIVTSPNAATCLWDITINSGLSTPNFSAPGETTAHMQDTTNYEDYYVDWDFTDIWDPPTAAAYPTLQWQA